jgi:hypothetical protein
MINTIRTSSLMLCFHALFCNWTSGSFPFCKRFWSLLQVGNLRPPPRSCCLLGRVLHTMKRHSQVLANIVVAVPTQRQDLLFGSSLQNSQIKQREEYHLEAEELRCFQGTVNRFNKVCECKKVLTSSRWELLCI